MEPFLVLLGCLALVAIIITIIGWIIWVTIETKAHEDRLDRYSTEHQKLSKRVHKLEYPQSTLYKDDED